MNIYLNKPHITKDIVVFEGDTYTQNINLFDDCALTGIIVDTTGWLFELVIRDRFNNIITSISAPGSLLGVDLVLTSIDTTQYPSDSYRYSIRYVDNTLPLPNIKTIIKGRFIILNNSNI